MKTSLIIPCLNEEKYLGKCLDSVVKQTVFPDEVIVCDNGSKDKTLKVAKKYLNLLPLKILIQPKKGIIPAIEKAWRKASGDIILKIDADSVLPQDWTKNMVNHFKKDPELAACGGNWYASDGGFWLRLFVKLIYPIGSIYFFFKGYKIIMGPNFAVRKSVLQKLNGYIVDNPHRLDDEIICHKLKINGYKYESYKDCYNYHSTRRWHHNPKGIMRSFLVNVFGPRLYRYRE
ncbi:MAG: glycosyltransferase family 2 protein [Patescibacteria group bacterium]|nr:glycosyltransferase family 2 protein [Patescibacteria group bacterium]